MTFIIDHNKPRAELGSDGNAGVIISPSVLKPEWGDFSKIQV